MQFAVLLAIFQTIVAQQQPPALVTNAVVSWASPAGIIARSYPNLDLYREHIANVR